MFVRLMQATTITLALYVLLGLSALQTKTAESGSSEVNSVQPSEALVAIKQAFTRRQ